MKIREISEKYGVPEVRFEMFIGREAEKLGIKTKGIFKDAVADEDVERAVKEYKEYEMDSPAGQKKKQEEEEQRLQREREERERGDRAIANAGGYWEYKVMSLVDDNGGGISSAELESTMNSLGSYGWHLKVAYANEIGRNSSSSGVYGVSTGTNATIDQNILIFERFVKV